MSNNRNKIEFVYSRYIYCIITWDEWVTWRRQRIHARLLTQYSNNNFPGCIYSNYLFSEVIRLIIIINLNLFNTIVYNRTSTDTKKDLVTEITDSPIYIYEEKDFCLCEIYMKSRPWSCYTVIEQQASHIYDQGLVYGYISNIIRRYWSIMLYAFHNWNVKSQHRSWSELIINRVHARGIQRVSECWVHFVSTI
jgi:hypothetical protein